MHAIFYTKFALCIVYTDFYAFLYFLAKYIKMKEIINIKNNKLIKNVC